MELILYAIGFLMVLTMIPFVFSKMLIESYEFKRAEARRKKLKEKMNIVRNEEDV